MPTAAPPRIPDAPLPRGFRAAGVWAGIKAEGRGLDLGLLVAQDAFPAAALFTRNALLGAHVHVCREHLARSGGLVRAVLVNSGCANCATGAAGVEDGRQTAAAVAAQLDCPAEQVLPISTGAIGSRLPLQRILDALPALVECTATATPSSRSDPRHPAAAAAGSLAFARAIMTTDTHPKVAAETCRDANDAAEPARVVGIAKGSGMIHPDLATMLAFVLTDAPLGSGLAARVQALAARAFHRVTVDGDTSPNDTLLLWSSGRAQAEPTATAAALERTAQALARQIAADGEGATRLVTVAVRGAPSEADAVHVARLIATSPLVKTAVAGRDPNWGRILAAAGRSGVAFDPARARVWIGATTVYEAGAPHPEREPIAAEHLRTCREVELGIDMAAGEGAAEVWTCDLTAEYVRINADYRT